MTPAVARFRNILDFTLAAMLRRKGKNLLLLSMFTLVISVFASILLFTHSLRHEAGLILKEAPEIIIQRLVAGRHDLIPLELGDRVSALPGVQMVTPRLWGYYFDPSTSATYTLVVPPTGQVPEGTVRIGVGVGRSRRVFPGKSLAMQGYDGKEHRFEIGELIPEESELVSSDLVIISAQDFRSLFSYPKGYATDLAVTVANPREISTVALKITESLPNTRVVTRNDMVNTYQSLFNWRSGVMALIFVSTLLSFAVFAWDRATGLSAEERRETGILKAIGWETSDILLMKLCEGAIISLLSFLGGCILAWVHIHYFWGSLFGSFLKGWSTLYPYFRLAPVLDLFQMSVLFMLTVPPYIAAILIPSWRAASMDPDTVMREP
ncbi:MAG: FtsX-like permease family protein [Desulfuromonadales bacterium]|nr:FtsX-like permease family protein [Desulfuromonadales bacterium]